MSFTGTLAGMLEGFERSRGRQREEQRLDETAALEGKRDLARLVMQELLAGRARPEGAVPVLNDFLATYQDRPSTGGMRGFFGDTQEAPTPSIDAVMGGQRPWSGPGGMMYSPEEQQQREGEWLGVRKHGEAMQDLKTWRETFPMWMDALTKMGVQPDTARNILLTQKFSTNALGIRGAPFKAWNPVSKKLFMAQRTGLGGVQDVMSGELVPDAQAWAVEEILRADGSRAWMNMATREVVMETPPGTEMPGQVRGFFPPTGQGFLPQPYFNYPGAAAPGMPGQQPGMQPGPQAGQIIPYPGLQGWQAPPANAGTANPETADLRHWLNYAQEQAQRQIKDELDRDRYGTVYGPTADNGAEAAAAMQQRIRDEVAARVGSRWGIKTMEEFESRAGMAPSRNVPGGTGGANQIPLPPPPGGQPMVNPGMPQVNIEPGFFGGRAVPQPMAPGTPLIPAAPQIGTPQMQMQPNQPGPNEMRPALIGNKTYLVRPMPNGVGWASTTDMTGRTGWTGPVKVNGQLWQPQ